MISVIIQARMSSTRLPEKIMLEVCGKTLLEHMILRIKKSKKINICGIKNPHAFSINIFIDFLPIFANLRTQKH